MTKEQQLDRLRELLPNCEDSVYQIQAHLDNLNPKDIDRYVKRLRYTRSLDFVICINERGTCKPLYHYEVGQSEAESIRIYNGIIEMYDPTNGAIIKQFDDLFDTDSIDDLFNDVDVDDLFEDEDLDELFDDEDDEGLDDLFEEEDDELDDLF